MRNFLKNKKASEMTIGTIVIIVLALIVLVVLVVGFSQGWGNLWTWFGNLWPTGSNIDAVVNGCVTACSTQAKDSYCNQLRDVKFTEKSETKPNGKYNCAAIASLSIGLAPCEAFGSANDCGPKQPCEAWNGKLISSESADVCGQGPKNAEDITGIPSQKRCCILPSTP